MPPLAYHLTWTTYGTWLPGDERGWVKKKTLGIQSPDAKLQDATSALLEEEAVFLTQAQRANVETTITVHCRIRGWSLHAVNARTNHVHVVVTADTDADTVMDQLKAWCSRKLSNDAGLTEPVAYKAGRRRWFTEGGSKEIIDNESYLENAIRYVKEGQDKKQ
jgi:REP element-mobilizing transposase RayT